VAKRKEAQGPQWHIAMQPGKRKLLSDSELGQMLRKVEKVKASIRAKVEHPFHIVKNKDPRASPIPKVRNRGFLPAGRMNIRRRKEDGKYCICASPRTTISSPMRHGAVSWSQQDGCSTARGFA